MSDNLTTLIEQFVPNNERYRSSVKKLEAGWFKRSKVRMFEVAWQPVIGTLKIVGKPASIRDESKLVPVVWITEDRQLAVKKTRYVGNIPDDKLMVLISPKQLSAHDRKYLFLGLTSQFDQIDLLFNASRKENYGRVIDQVAQDVRANYDSAAAEQDTLQKRLLDPTLDPQLYEARKDELLRTLFP